MKEAIVTVSGVQLLQKEEIPYVEIIHRKGEKSYFGLKTYKDDVIKYKGVLTKFNLDSLARFLGKAIEVDEENKIYCLPQVRVLSKTAFYEGNLKTTAYETNEEAEKAFNELVEKYKLTVI